MNSNAWYNVRVKYTKQLDDGRLQRVTEPYLIDSVSFTDAEARFYEEIGQNIRGEYTITGIAKKEYMDIFYYEDSDDWYECKLTYVSEGDEEEKSKKVKCVFLVTANSVKEACARIDESLSDMMVSYEITNVGITTITDVLPYNPDSTKELDRKAMDDVSVEDLEVENEIEDSEGVEAVEEEVSVDFQDDTEEE